MKDYYIIEGIEGVNFDTREKAEAWAWEEHEEHYPRILSIDTGQLLQQLIGVVENLADKLEDFDLRETLQNTLDQLRRYGIASPENLQNPLWQPVAAGDFISIAERQRRDEEALLAWNDRA